ncbi:hypothetical protein GA840_06480 [Pediococcus ethanolidurans]|uniref:hypothetical protein n=1 Tax=Pediococcus ethanolidurans TaxID=319653 RepID=UPI002955511B|nr:hypothetical protein [Pediococcus ethanolidurans]MDV7719494.1 hypothetical protein [Pediococcus ethanolidurans]
MIIPKEYSLVQVATAPYNNKKINIKRYQKQPRINYNGPHITIVSDEEGLVYEYSSLTHRNNFALPTDNAAKMIAQQMITAIEPKRFSKLSFLEIEDQERFFIDRNGNRQMIPILWVKYSDTTDGFSWVGIAGNGEVVEYERQAFYDYVNGGGKTEQWINDDWLLQHKSLFFKSKLTGSQKCEETNDD